LQGIVTAYCKPSTGRKKLLHLINNRFQYVKYWLLSSQRKKYQGCYHTVWLVTGKSVRRLERNQHAPLRKPTGPGRGARLAGHIPVEGKAVAL
jgi:hypothetical protein